MLRILSLITFIILLSFAGYAQAGLQVYTGISKAKSKNALLTPEGSSHNGYHLGADGRLNSGNMYFMIGGQYHVINFLARPGGDYFSVKDKMSWIKLRFGLGYNVININEKIALRAKSLLAIDLISSHPDDLPDAPYSTYNSGTAGAVVGIGMDIFAFTIDIEYEKGFFNAVNMVKDTQFDFLCFNVGVRF